MPLNTLAWNNKIGLWSCFVGFGACLSGQLGSLRGLVRTTGCPSLLCLFGPVFSSAFGKLRVAAGGIPGGGIVGLK